MKRFSKLAAHLCLGRFLYDVEDDLQEVGPKMCLLVVLSRQPVSVLFFISAVMQIKGNSFPQQTGERKIVVGKGYILTEHFAPVF